jgi:predicted AlkP superfamily pyrophosphatase or phosphodiesterase
LVIRSKRFLSISAAGYDLNAVCEKNSGTMSLNSLTAVMPSQLSQHLDALIVLLKSDGHGLPLQGFQLVAVDAVHLRIGLAEEVDRVVHEFGQRLRWPLSDCHPGNGRPILQ